MVYCQLLRGVMMQNNILNNYQTNEGLGEKQDKTSKAIQSNTSFVLHDESPKKLNYEEEVLDIPEFDTAYYNNMKIMCSKQSQVQSLIMRTTIQTIPYLRISKSLISLVLMSKK